MGLEEIIITRWIKNHSTEEKLERARRMVPNLLKILSREDLMTLASQITPDMMKRCWDCMPREDLIETAHTIMVQMMEHCLSSLPMKDREEMLAFYRETLRKMEQKFLTQNENL